MESSSEDGSFVWTDASNSTSSEDMVTNAGVGTSGGEESEYDKSYKKMLHKELFTNENGHEREVRSKKRKRERHSTESEHWETSKKKIKVEPESDLDVARVENKHTAVNGYDEQLLDEKVKTEQEFLLPSDKVKKKKRKKRTSNDNFDIHVKLDTELNKTEEKSSIDSNTEESSDRLVCEGSEHQGGYNVHKKKKNKKKSEKREESPHEMEIEEKTSISIDSRTKHTVLKDKPVRNEIRDCKDVEGDLTVNTTTADMDISEISKISDVNITHDESLSMQNNKHRRRLSERIQFEDEVVDSESSRDIRPASITRTRKPNDRLKQFAKKNNRFKVCTSRELTEFTIGERDDVWLVTCPSEVDVTAFGGRSLELGGRCKVKLSGAGYEGYAVPAAENEPRAALMVGARVRRVPLAGRLQLHRRLPRAPDAAAHCAPPPASRVALPHTKLRHPLLGAHYKKALKLPPAVTERLRAAPPPTEHKRRRKSEAPTSAAVPTPASAPTASKKKAKRKKHDLEAPETWESERAIEESLFDF